MRNVSLRVVASLVLALCLDLFPASAQNASVSTDMVSYANFATLNLEASVPMARHWSVNASVKYNPFEFDLGEGREDARNKQQAYALGMRWWPWNVYSDGGSAENCNIRNIMSEA